MNFDEYQDNAVALALNTARNEAYLVPGLAAEVGEVCSLYAKMTRDGGNVNDFRASLKKEVGDVLWFVANICAIEGFTLSEVAFENLQKLYDRQRRGVLGGSGDQR